MGSAIAVSRSSINSPYPPFGVAGHSTTSGISPYRAMILTGSKSPAVGSPTREINHRPDDRDHRGFRGGQVVEVAHASVLFSERSEDI